MTPEELSKLKQGDVVRHEETGAGYIVLSNRAGIPTVVRSIELHNGREWSHVYTPTPVKETAPPLPSLVDKVSALEGCGWRYDETLDNGHWIAPDGAKFASLVVAFANRRNHPFVPPSLKVKSFYEAQETLRKAGWVNVAGRVWRAPSGCFFDGTRCAYDSLTHRDGDAS